jgi:hypothetical protein
MERIHRIRCSDDHQAYLAENSMMSVIELHRWTVDFGVEFVLEA